MFDANALRGEIARRGMTQKSVADSIGISANTFSKKMKDGSFGIKECEAIVELLGIQNPGAIFFAER